MMKNMCKVTINKSNSPDFTLLIHNCNKYMKCGPQTSKQINEMSRICYLGIINYYFDNN